ncbi:MAG: winged helix-turn-helix transcriptional regulator [Halobacteriota archaeon]
MGNFEAEYDLAVLVLGQQLIAGKWTIPILWHLSKGKKRFSELHFFIRTPRSVFVQQLHQLEHSGFIKRKVYGEEPVRVEYSLTEIGVKLIPVFTALIDWSEQYIESQKEEGVSDVDFVVNSFMKDKYKTYQDIALLPKDTKPPKNQAL